MKETLDEQSRFGLMRYRMERADETMEEVDILSECGHYNAAVNRLYYACVVCRDRHFVFESQPKIAHSIENFALFGN